MAIARDKIVIVGAGHVGATAAYALMLRGLFTEIVLIDADEGRATAEATDIADANALARPGQIRSGTYADAADAQIVVLTAGAATHGDESRLSVADRSAVIVRECVANIMQAGFAGILIVASNPVDAMTQVAQEASGLEPGRVIGTGTLLDSARFRQRLARQLEVSPAAIEALVLGEHGDSEVAAFSTVRIGGMPLVSFLGDEQLPCETIAEEVRCAAYAIVHGKGYTSFGIATAIVRISEAIRRDERVVLPVSTLTSGEFGIEGVCLSLPCLIDCDGISRVLVPDLLEVETQALHRSAETLRRVVARLSAERS